MPQPKKPERKRGRPPGANPTYSEETARSSLRESMGERADLAVDCARSGLEQHAAIQPVMNELADLMWLLGAKADDLLRLLDQAERLMAELPRTGGAPSAGWYMPTLRAAIADARRGAESFGLLRRGKRYTAEQALVRYASLAGRKVTRREAASLAVVTGLERPTGEPTARDVRLGGRGLQPVTAATRADLRVRKWRKKSLGGT